MISWHRTPDLRLTIILLVVVPLLLVFGGGGIVVLGTLENRLEARLQEDISLIARTLKGPTSRALDRERDGAVQRALRSAIDFGRVYGVYVYDADGELVTRADRLAPESTPSTASSEVERLEHDDDIGDYRSIGGQDVFSYFTALTDSGGQVIGLLQVTRQVSEMRDYINSLLWQALAVLLFLSLVFVLIFAAGHHVALGGPILRLSQAMDRVSAGDSRARALVSGPREVRKLAERFNVMLDGIRERDRRLERQFTEQQRLTDKLRETEKFALAGRLASGVAHELGTPLSVVEGHLQRLLRREAEGTALHTSLTSIRAAARRMAEVVQHLLGFGSGQTTPPCKVSVGRLLKLAAADVRAQFDEAGTTLELSCAGEDIEVVVDESRLREALTHLLRNALYAAQGGRVLLSSETGDGMVRLAVEDSGPGISPGDEERIFEPFFTTKPPGDGSGLGLAVVRGIFTAHGGEVRINRSALGGAALVASLPCAEAGP